MRFGITPYIPRVEQAVRHAGGPVRVAHAGCVPEIAVPRGRNPGRPAGKRLGKPDGGGEMGRCRRFFLAR